MNGSGGLIIRCQAADAVAQRLERLRCALNELKCSVEDDDASSEGAAFELPEAATYHRLQDELSRGIEALSFDICGNASGNRCIYTGVSSILPYSHIDLSECKISVVLYCRISKPDTTPDCGNREAS